MMLWTAPTNGIANFQKWLGSEARAMTDVRPEFPQLRTFLCRCPDSIRSGPGSPQVRACKLVPAKVPFLPRLCENEDAECFWAIIESRR